MNYLKNMSLDEILEMEEVVELDCIAQELEEVNGHIKGQGGRYEN